MATYDGLDRFQTGKSFAHRTAEIKTAASSVTRMFKAGQVVDITDLEQIIEHATAMKAAAEFFNMEKKRELGLIVKTP